MLELVSDVLPRLRQDVRLHASFRRRLAVKLPSQDDRELVTKAIQAYEDGKLDFMLAREKMSTSELESRKESSVARRRLKSAVCALGRERVVLGSRAHARAGPRTSLPPLLNKSPTSFASVSLSRRGIP